MHRKTTSAPALSAKYVLRSYDPNRADEKEILEVFNLVFGQSRGLEHWRWKYAANPYGQIAASLACDAATGKVVAHYTAIPVLWNVKGQPRLGCQSVDTLVHPEHRRQGLFEATAEDFFTRCEAQQVYGVYGFPGEEAYPGFARKLGWQRVAAMQRYCLRLSLYPEFKRALKVGPLAYALSLAHRATLKLRLRARAIDLRRRLGGDVEFHRSETVPVGYDSLWQATKSYEVLSIWKDEKYFKWRYDQHPDRRYRYAYLSRGNRILALAVLNTDGESAQLCELVCAEKQVLAARYLLTRLALACQRSGSWRLIFQGRDFGFFDEAFAGFERNRVYNFLLCGKLFAAASAAQGEFALADNWTITQGDSDHV